MIAKLKSYGNTVIDNISLTFRNSRTVAVLAAVLGIQMVLAVALFWNSTGQGSFHAAQSVAGFDAGSADKLIIADQSNTLTLSLVDERWQMSGDKVYPVDSENVRAALENLSDLQAGLPVATSVSSQSQLEVADENYQRKLTVMQGDEQLLQLYIGTSPGFRKAHTRIAGDEAIYAANINVFDFDMSEDSWLDRQLLAFETATEIAGDGFALLKKDNVWTFTQPTDLQNTHTVDTALADGLLEALQQFTVTAIHRGEAFGSAESDTTEPVADTALDAPVADSTDDVSATESEGDPLDSPEFLSFTVQLGDKPIVLSMARQDGTAYAERDDVAGRFTISESLFDQFSGFTSDTLIVEDNDANVN